MTDEHDGNGESLSRRKVLQCMTWAGTGVLWTVAGGVPQSIGRERLAIVDTPLQA